jgi:salicylate hydroxylase
MKTPRPVLIAGGGIGGLSTAIALDRAGLEAHVLERSAFAEESGAGIQLGPNATRILRNLGVLDALLPQTFRPDAVWLFDGLSGKKLATVPLGEVAERRYGAPYVTVHRADLHEALKIVATAGERIALTPHFTVAHVDDEDGVGVTRSGGETLQGTALVGADGLWSTVRNWVAPGAEPSFTGATAFRSLLPRKTLPEPFSAPIVGLWLGPRSHVVHYPVRGGAALNVVAVTESGHKEQGWNWSATRETVLGKFARWCDAPLGLLEAAPDWRAWSLFSLQPLPQWHRGATVLLGDAAHPVLPYLAQGAGLAIEDAAKLAALLGAAREGLSAAYPAYETIRRQRARRVQQTSQRLGLTYHMGDAFLGEVFRRSRNAILRLRGETATLRSFDWLYGGPGSEG